MQPHRFAVGQKVIFSPGAGDHRSLGGAYRVVKLLSSEALGPQYRVKSDADRHERVVLETQLTGTPDELPGLTPDRRKIP
jgi:hypothetical protein